MSCFEPGGKTVIPKTECSAPTVSRVSSQRTSMSTQPSSERSAASLGVASKLRFIGWSLTRRVTSVTLSPPVEWTFILEPDASDAPVAAGLRELVCVERHVGAVETADPEVQDTRRRGGAVVVGHWDTA